MTLGLLAWLPLALSGAVGSPSLGTFAAASPRPDVCRAPASRSGGALEGEIWARARRERAARFCVVLARGYARLERTPKEALAEAREARRILPGEIEPAVLEGRALLRLGDLAAAERALAESVMAPGRPLGDLAGLRELGVAHALVGHRAEAARIYRVLVPRVDFVKDRLFARVALLEAAASTMASGVPGAHEAGLYLSQARQAAPVPGFQDFTLALLALALDRAGKDEQARVVLEELEGPWSLERFLPQRSDLGAALAESGPILREGEIHAAIALAASRADLALARAHFEEFLRLETDGPWTAWGRKWLAALSSKARP